MELDHTLDIAIVGMAGRFPGAEDIDRFWENLCEGKESITFFSEEEMRSAGVPADVLTQPNYVPAAPVLDDVEAFDARFFGYSPREARHMDPQHRLLLQEAWRAFEHAGYDPHACETPVSVFAGSAMNTYILFSGLLPQFVEDYLPTLIGSDKDFLATRISYKLNLKGPSVTVQTACSTSLVAVHMACQSLLNDECSMALAGGVSVRVPHRAGHLHTSGSVFTPDGHCRPFDAGANGTIFGSGVGMVLLKRLEDALADNDTIHGVIKGSAINNDGGGKSDYTAPSIQSQADAVTEALAVAGVEARTIGYVEAHGTGTFLGDPIEVAALTRAFRAYTDENQFCRIGSVKSNIGHLDAAAGMAGLFKTLLALKHGKIPATLHYTAPNPEIDFVASPFTVNDALTDWQATEGPRRAGVNSLGIGGTNAHVILEEAPGVEASGASRARTLLTLSAQTPEALEEASRNLADFLEDTPATNLADASYTLRVGRRDMKHRRAFVCDAAEDAVSALRDVDPDVIVTSETEAAGREVVFMFPGQGSQYANMTREIYETEPEFALWVDRCADLLAPHIDKDIRTLLYPDEDALEEAGELLKQTQYTQPALFAVEYALARLWMSWGVEPGAMIGHSIGEYVAACLAGVFELEDALYLVASRSRLIQARPGGAMLSAPLSEEEIAGRLTGGLALAAVNAPSACVIAGPEKDIEVFARQLEEDKVETRRLVTSHAFHSAMMDAMLDAFSEVVAGVTLRAPNIPFVSNVTGTWITAGEATDPQYWARHVRQTVRFSAGMRTLMEDPARIYLEVGPGQTLSSFARRQGSLEQPVSVVQSVRHPLKDASDQATLLRALGSLWTMGAPADWERFYAGEARRRIPLPTYPFEKNRHWYEMPVDGGVLGATIPEPATFYTPIWKQAPVLAPVQDEARPKRWLFFLDREGLAERLAERAVRRGETVTRVSAGHEFGKVGARQYALNPASARDYEELIEAAIIQDGPPTHIVFAWPVEDEEGVGRSAFFGLTHLARALGARTHTDSIQLNVISTDLQDVIGSETLNPENALLLGPCKVIPHEYPHIFCRSVDVDPVSAGASEELEEALMEEFSSGAADPVVAYRGSRRWVMDLSAVELPLPMGSRLRKKGVYLITGGLGDLGMEIAEYLAASWQARLVLVGRSAWPPRDTWDALDEDDVDSSVREKMARVLRMESSGAEVFVGSADVTSVEAMRALVEAAEERLGPIEGIVHAAGIVEDRVIQLKDTDTMQRVLAPKVEGTRVIEQLFDERPLDWLVLFSSVSAIGGAPGQVDYSAGNAYLDAWARASAGKTARFVASINWAGWKRVGMAARMPGTNTAPAAWIEPADGIDAFCRVLSGSLPQVIVSPVQPAFAGIQAQRAIASKPAVSAAASDPENAPRDEVEAVVARAWSEVLGISSPDVNDDFFECGGSSLLATQLISRLSGFNAGLTIQDVFNASTVAKLSRRIKKSVEPHEKAQKKPQIKAVSRDAYRI